MAASSAIRRIWAQRRWLRFSLRTLLVAVTLLCAWVGWQAHKARRQAAAVAAVQSLGGIVIYDDQRDSRGALDYTAAPPAPSWLHRNLGEHYSRRVVVVVLNMAGDRRKTRPHGLAGASKLKILHLYNTGVTGQGLRHLSGLRTLEHLDVSYSPFSDEGMEHLSRCANLKSLTAHRTKISDNGLKYLLLLSALENLGFMNTGVTDAGLEHLQQLRSLRQVSLHYSDATSEGIARLRKALPGCSVAPPQVRLRPPRDVALWRTDQPPSQAELLAKIKEIGGSATQDLKAPEQPIVRLQLHDSDISEASLLRILAELPELKELNLRHLVIGDLLLEGLSMNPHLRTLSLGDTRITDEGLRHLAGLDQLRELSLSMTRIGDRGLLQLTTLKSLRHISTQHTRVTAEGIREFKQAKPNCTVVPH